MSPSGFLLVLSLLIACDAHVTLQDASRIHHGRHRHRHPRSLTQEAQRALIGIPPATFGPMPRGLSLPSCTTDPIMGNCKPTNVLLLSSASNLTGAVYGGR